MLAPAARPGLLRRGRRRRRRLLRTNRRAGDGKAEHESRQTDQA